MTTTPVCQFCKYGFCKYGSRGVVITTTTLFVRITLVKSSNAPSDTQDLADFTKNLVDVSSESTANLVTLN